MRTIITAAAILGLLSVSANAAVSKCKGLEQPVCTKDVGCQWRQEQVAGQPTKSKPDQVYKRSMKAHCRLPAFQKAPQA